VNTVVVGGALFNLECEQPLGLFLGGIGGESLVGITGFVMKRSKSACRVGVGLVLHFGTSEPMTAWRVATSSGGGEGNSFIVFRWGGVSCLRWVGVVGKVVLPTVKFPFTFARC
jgi:hypothetical protein